MNEQELMQKLALSKAIMDKSEGIKRGASSHSSLPSTSLQEFSMPNARYNIPQDMLMEQPQQKPYLSSVPNTKPVGVPTVDAIKNSKLPDEIKKLMIEHPIAQPQNQQAVTLSDDLVERATRLMKENKSGYVPESQRTETKKTEKTSNLDLSKVQKMVEEAVNKALKENGLLVESTEKADETFSFKVGKHIFEGKVTKIKKLS